MNENVDHAENLALGKTTVINQGGTLATTDAAYITDGDPTTMWRSYSPGAPSVLAADVTLDLGSLQLFNKIVLTEYKQKANQLLVSISDDNASWNVVHNEILPASSETNRETTITVDNLAARYIKLSAPDASCGFGIYELEVYNISSFSSMIVCTDHYGGPEVKINYPKRDFHLYLLIGQSNMASRAPFESQDIAAMDRTYLFNGLNQWESAGAGLIANNPGINTLQGLNRYSSVEVMTKTNGYSLGSSFAQAITERFPDISVGIISNARGGTTMAEWQKGSGTDLYEEAVRRTLSAMESGTLKGILWHQGESDVGHVSTYMSSLHMLIANLREDLGVPDVPLIVGQILPGKSDSFNTLLTTVGQHIEQSEWVSSNDTFSIGDGTHFDNASQKLLGLRYADKMIPRLLSGFACESD